VTGVISLSDILNFLVLRPGGDDPSQPGCTDMFSKAVGTVGPWGQVVSPEPANQQVVKSESTTAAELSEPLSKTEIEESSSSRQLIEESSSNRQLSKSSSADSAVEATEETLAGEEHEKEKEEEERKEEGERTSCDKERLGEEERERMSLAEIPTH